MPVKIAKGSVPQAILLRVFSHLFAEDAALVLSRLAMLDEVLKPDTPMLARGVRGAMKRTLAALALLAMNTAATAQELGDPGKQKCADWLAALPAALPFCRRTPGPSISSSAINLTKPHAALSSARRILFSVPGEASRRVAQLEGVIRKARRGREVLIRPALIALSPGHKPGLFFELRQNTWEESPLAL